MSELNVNKDGFSACYDNLKYLSTRLQEVTFPMEDTEDTSFAHERERQCHQELMIMIRDLAALADETAKDVRLTQARYVLADK